LESLLVLFPWFLYRLRSTPPLLSSYLHTVFIVVIVVRFTRVPVVNRDGGAVGPFPPPLRISVIEADPKAPHLEKRGGKHIIRGGDKKD
jgi:hypothetical protein